MPAAINQGSINRKPHNAMDHASLLRNQDILMKEDEKLIMEYVFLKNPVTLLLNDQPLMSLHASLLSKLLLFSIHT